MAKKLYSLKDLKKEDWLELRRDGIGGSEIGAIAGVSKYSSPLSVYVDKTAEVIDDIDNNFMKWGRLLEDTVAKQFEEESKELTGYEFSVRNDNFVYADDEFDYMRASVDRKLNNPELGMGILEVKTSTGLYVEEWADEQMPDSYYCQLMWYLGIRGYKYGYIVCLFLATREMVVRRIDFDQEVFDGLKEICTNFWNDFILAKNMPAPSGMKCDDDIVRGLTLDTIADSVAMDETEETHKKILERFEFDKMIKDCTVAKKQIEQELKLQVGTNWKLVTKEYNLTYKPNKNGKRSLRFAKRKDI